MNKFIDTKGLKQRIGEALKNGKRAYEVDKPCSDALLRIAVSHGAYLRILKKEPVTVFETDPASENMIIETLKKLGYAPRRRRSAVYSYKKRYGLFCGLAVFIALFICLSQMIWSIDIEGNKRLTEEDVLSLLAECGVREGMWNRRIDSDRTRIQMMNRSRDIAWMSINVSGMVARVELVETSLGEEEEKNDEYCNIVASADGVITDITVERGKPMVAVGDTVKKGELLISGIIEERDGDISLVRAKGVVVARTEKEVAVTKELREQIKVQTGERLKKISVNLFGKTINFSINGGLREENCDIITKKGSFTLFGGFRLPINYKAVYEAEINEYCENITYDDARSFCEREAYSLVLKNGAELVARKISVDKTEDSVTLKLFAVCEENIGLAMPFTAEP